MARRRFAGAAAQTGSDEISDGYTVTRLGEGVLQVKHFPTVDATKACCTLQGTVTDADRAQGIVEDLNPEIYALHRAYLASEKRHAAAAVKAGAA